MKHPTNQKQYYDTCRYLHVQTKCVTEMDEDSSENNLATKSEGSMDDEMLSGLQINVQQASLFSDKLCCHC